MSFLQDAPDSEEKMMKLEGVMEKLKGLDPKTFGMLNGMLEKAQIGQSFMQVVKPDMEDRLMKLQPVLEKLHGLDPKTFGMLNQMLDQAQVVSLLQEKTEPMDMEDRLAKLGPILDKLKNLDPKTAGMLGKMVGMSFIQEPDAEDMPTILP